MYNEQDEINEVDEHIELAEEEPTTPKPEGANDWPYNYTTEKYNALAYAWQDEVTYWLERNVWPGEAMPPRWQSDKSTRPVNFVPIESEESNYAPEGGHKKGAPYRKPLLKQSKPDKGVYYAT